MPTGVSRTWITYNSAEDHSEDKKQTVRSHAAAASWAARKQQWQNTVVADPSLWQRNGASDEPRATASNASGGLASPSPLGSSMSSSKAEGTRGVPSSPVQPPDAWRVLLQIDADCTAAMGSSQFTSASTGPAQLRAFVRSVQEHRQWFAGSTSDSSLAQKATRTLLWDAYAGSAALSNTALFVAGTHTHSFGSSREGGLVLSRFMRALRVAAVKMVEADVTAPHCEPSAPLALALLAGWERRYGAQGAWPTQVKLWRRACLPASALEEDISSLTDVTLDIIRQELNERSYINRRDISFATPDPVAPRSIGKHHIPSGFKVFRIDRPEHRSLLCLATDVYRAPLDTIPALQVRRKLQYALTGWSPTHTASIEASLDILRLRENEYADHAELSALYHVRAALRLLNSLCSFRTQETLGVLPLAFYPVQRALDSCCASYVQSLDSHSLLGTRFERLAFWSRFSLCASSFTDSQASFVRQMMYRMDLDTWASVEAVLLAHMDAGLPDIWGQCRKLFDHLTIASVEGEQSSHDARMAVRDLWR